MKKYPRGICFTGSIVLIIGLTFSSPISSWAQATKWGLRPVAMGKYGMVVSANPLASQAGMKILAKGGNAVDAIVAVAAALNVVETYMSGMGGIGYMLLYSSKENKIRALDFAGWAPLAAKADTIDPKTDKSGNIILQLESGPRAPLVPGNLAGWAKALKDYGTMSLAEVFEPAIEYAENGFYITPFDEGLWAGSVGKLAANPAAASIYLKNGMEPFRAGDFFVNKKLARTLKRVAEGGIEVFYKGELAREIETAFKRDGGFITVEDMASVPDKVQWRDPISINYRGYTIYTNPIPGQGIQQLQELKIMEGFDVKSMGHNSVEYLSHLLETVYLCRIETDKIADPKYVPAEDVDEKRLLSDAYLSQQREKVLAAVKKRTAKLDRVHPQSYSAYNIEEGCTTHLAVADRWGNAVNITQTNDSGFGSGYVPGDTGLLFNNGMYRWFLDPKRAMYLVPGKHSSYCMGILQIHKNGKPFMTIGSPGNYGILQTVPQVVMNVIDFEMNIQDAIGAPRFRWNDNYLPAKDITMEARVPINIMETLMAKGYKINSGGDWTMAVGGAQGIVIDQEKGWLMGGADPRRNGYAVGW